MADATPFASVEIEGIKKATVESIDVEDHDRAIDRARVIFDSADDISKIVREQSKVKISLGWSTEKAFIFEGIVMGVKNEALGTGQQRVTVTAYDLSYRMRQNQSSDRLFSSGKLSDALKKIVSDYAKGGIRPGQIVPDPDPTFTPDNYWGKVKGKSDWDFIQEAAIKWKARAFVEVNNNESQFYFVSEKSLLKGDPMGLLHYCPGGVGPLITFEYQRVASGASPVSTITVVDPQTGEPVTKQVTPPPPEPPLQIDSNADAQLAQAADIMAKASGKPEEARPKTSVPGMPYDPIKAEQDIQQDPTRILGFYGKGVATGTIMLRAKGKVTIKGIAPWAEGDWYVHKVNHVYTRITVTDKKMQQQDRSTYQTKFSATR